AVFAVLWMIHNLPLATRGTIAALGFALPLALLTVVPAGVQPALDGVFAGTLAGALAWIVRGAVRSGAYLRPIHFRRRPANSAVTGALLIAAMYVPSSAIAQAPSPRAGAP